MKIQRALVVLVVTAPLAFGQTRSDQASPAGPVEQEIVDLERARLKAFADDDKATFEKLVADDLTLTHSSGGVSSKAALMAGGSWCSGLPIPMSSSRDSGEWLRDS